MQWNGNVNAGFSEVAPWLPVPPSFKTHNVETQLKDPDSILQFYKHLLRLRREETGLRDGEYVPLNDDQTNVVSYLRSYKNEAVLVVLNMSATDQQMNFDLGKQGFSAAKATTLLTTLSTHPQEVTLASVSMEPFAVYIGKISK